MSGFEVSYDLDGEYGEVILLQKRGDKYSIVEGRKSKKSEGTIKPVWVIPPDKNGEPKRKDEDNYQFIPQGLKLGNKTEAVTFLRWALGQLEPHNAKPVPQPLPSGDDEDCPF